MSEKRPLSVSDKGVLRLRAVAGMALTNRLNQHARAIDQVNNLNLGDFSCRYLVVDDMWIPLAESSHRALQDDLEHAYQRIRQS